MAQRWSGWYWHLGLASFLGMSGAIADFGNSALAQITPDGTLGAESSVVTTTNIDGLPTQQIDGGATRGANLFHSFEQFSVPTGGAAFFNNALNIQNIISRVTGSSVSNIDGLLRANGTANVFLLNPNGIIFGPNASLNIGGSFLGSTASSLNFADGTNFSATEPQTTPLLTISVPIGLQFGGTTGDIRVQGGADLQVQPGRTLGLVGSDVALEGSVLTAEEGHIELGRVGSPSLVSLTPTAQGWVLGYEGVENFQDIQLLFATDVSGDDIQVRGRQITLSHSEISSTTNLTVTASELVEVSGTSSSFYTGPGTAEDLTITTGKLIIRDGARVFADAEGLGGSLVVTAAESVKVIGTSELEWSFGRFLFGSLLSTTGDLTITTGKLIVLDGAEVSASNFFAQRQTGNLTVTASESVKVIGTDADGNPSSLSTNNYGPGGTLTITTGQLNVLEGAQVTTSTAALGFGDAGNLIIRASDSVKVSGDFSRLSTSVGRRGTEASSGNLTLETGRLIVQDGAQISAGTLGSGSSGNLEVRASESVELSGTSSNGQRPSLLTAQTTGFGDAGDLTIETGQLTLRDRAGVSVSSTGSGNAGNLEVVARSVQLDNQGKLTANTTAGQGNIILRAQDLVLRRGSFITTNARGTATGGNITINTDVLAALENSDISANSVEAFGGRVRINAQGIFGTEFREDDTPQSDITAISDPGLEFSGTVELNTPDVDPSRGLVTLPAELVDASNQISQRCGAGGRQGESKFIVTGRGGLPLRPGDAHISHYPTGSVRSIPSSSPSIETNPLFSPLKRTSAISQGMNSLVGEARSARSQIVEATGWVINNKGEVVLTDIAPNATPNIPWMTPATCHGATSPTLPLALSTR